MNTIYDELKAKGFEMDNHESDLYVKVCPEFVAFIKERNQHNEPVRLSFFKSKTDGKLWAELPFQYSPFWERKAAIAKQLTA